MTIESPAAPSASPSVEFHPLTVRVRPETDDAVAVTLEVPPELRETFRHVPGQHVVLRADLDGHDVRRSYSICTGPSAAHPQVAIKRIPDGVFSTWATTELRTGDTVEAMPPIGDFSYEPDPGVARRYVAMAAGSGITPVLSILTAILEVEGDSSCTLIYGNRRVSSIMFLEELDALKSRHPDRFQVVHVLSRESHAIPLFEGRVDDAKIRTICSTIVDPAAVDAWFLCGPLEMIECAESTLADVGVEADRVHYELFFDERIEVVPDDTHAEGAVTLTVTIDGRTSTVAVDPSGPPILEYARSVRSEVPFACKGGMCATCKARVTDGEVTMEKNYALTDQELADGYVLTCQAHPASGDLSISYDVHGGLGR